MQEMDGAEREVLMKQIIRMVLAGICLGLVLLLVQKGLHIEEAVFMKWYWLAAPGIIAAAVLVHVLYHYSYQKKMRALAALLEEGSTDAYIEGVQSLLASAKSNSLKQVLKLNLSAGYCEKRQFEAALGILEELSEEPLHGVIKMIHRLNLCVCYFYMSQNDKALSLYRESEKTFAPYRGSSSYGGNLAVLDMLAAIAKGDYFGAKKLLEHAKSTWNTKRLAAEYADLEKLIVKKTAG